MIVTFTGQKGGAGKSTSAVCLGVAALERGQRVLLVDADPQGTVRTWGEVATERGRSVPTVVAMGAAMHKPGQLREIAEGYDLTVIDCPPRHGDVQRSALMIADLAVLPCGPSAADAWALTASLDVVKEAQTLRDELQACVLVTRKQSRTALGKGARAVLESCGLPVLESELGVLVTRKQSRTALGKGARAVLESCGLPVLESELGYRIAFQEAMAVGMGITTYAPRDVGTKETFNLLDELERLFHGQKASGRFVAQASAH